MLETPLVSVVLPVFNGARFLAAALDSVLDQSTQPLELIVVDDGSTDDTPVVVAAYGDRVRSVRQTNAGPASARNAGLQLATGDFVAFQDADDLWLPHKLEKQMAFLQARPELDLCITHALKFWMPEVAQQREEIHDHSSTKALPGFVCQTLLARRGLFDEVGRFDESLPVGEDTDWFLRVRHAGHRIEAVPEVLVHRRMHEHNLSHTIHTPAGIAARLRIAQAALKRQRAQSGR